MEIGFRESSRNRRFFWPQSLKFWSSSELSPWHPALPRAELPILVLLPWCSSLTCYFNVSFRSVTSPIGHQSWRFLSPKSGQLWAGTGAIPQCHEQSCPSSLPSLWSWRWTHRNQTPLHLWQLINENNISLHHTHQAFLNPVYFKAWGPALLKPNRCKNRFCHEVKQD